jgi:tRNA/rRNA methyltransferase
MSNFGFSTLRVVNPYEVSFREARSAVGAAGLLSRAQEFTSLAGAVADCELVVGTISLGHRQIQHPMRPLDEAGPCMLAQPRNMALVFGSEKVGLSNQDLSHCHWLLNIPTSESNASMNLGQAVAVCLYELVRRPVGVPEPGAHPRAPAGELERITNVLTEALLAAGYMKPEALPSTEEKVRRLIRRLSLSAADAELLLGMLRQIGRTP